VKGTSYEAVKRAIDDQDGIEEEAATAI